MCCSRRGFESQPAVLKPKTSFSHPAAFFTRQLTCTNQGHGGDALQTLGEVLAQDLRHEHNPIDFPPFLPQSFGTFSNVLSLCFMEH